MNKAAPAEEPHIAPRLCARERGAAAAGAFACPQSRSKRAIEMK